MRKYLRFFVSLILIIAVLGAASGCGAKKPQQAAGPVITITDCAGRTVEVPEDPQSICCICPFSGPMLVMYGLGEKITSSCRNVVRSNLLAAMCPEIADITVVKNSGSVNAEEVIRLKTDLIIVNSGTYYTDDERKKLDNMGIPYVVIGFEDLESQLEAMLVLGRATHKEEKAEKYVSWCRSVYDEIKEVTANVKSEPKQLYHAVNEAVRTDNADSICAQWIALTNAVNVSVGTELTSEGDKSFTTLEQIYNWNPEMIICNETGIADYILKDPKWAGLSCVAAGEVYQIPVGISRMGHPTSTETPLALMWLENLLYPEEYPIDFKEKIKEYYRDFYGYEVSDELAESIIAGRDMRVENSVKQK